MRTEEGHYAGKDNAPVPTEEDRIAALERKVAMLELLRSQDERKAEEALRSPILRHLGHAQTMVGSCFHQSSFTGSIETARAALSTGVTSRRTAGSS